MNLFERWILAKKEEERARDLRREVEDQLLNHFEIRPDLDGTESFEEGAYKVRIIGRINRKVDTEAVQIIAAEEEIDWPTLKRAFRWKAEINKREFMKLPESVSGALSAAITATPGRASFKIEKQEES